MKKDIDTIVRADGRYHPQAAMFVHEGLGYAIKNIGDQLEQGGPRHISGAELCQVLRLRAIDKWGRLAKVVLNQWGVKTTRDFGEIVYLMIENEWMSAQPNDSIVDFDDIYDFQAVFEDNFKFDSDLQRS